MKYCKCGNCGKPLGEINKGKLHKELRYICQPCLMKYFELVRQKNTNPLFQSGFGDIFNGFK